MGPREEGGEMNHVMIDLETFGQTPGCLVKSIGAVSFNMNGINDDWRRNISIDSSLQEGFFVEGGALKFWLTQVAPDTQAALFHHEVELRAAIESLFAWFLHVKGKWVWSHGATFDIPILSVIYSRLGLKLPWEFRDARDTRTLYSLLPSGKPNVRRITSQHDALEDAIFQAHSVITAYRELGKKLEDEGPNPADKRMVSPVLDRTFHPFTTLPDGESRTEDSGAPMLPVWRK